MRREITVRRRASRMITMRAAELKGCSMKSLTVLVTTVALVAVCAACGSTTPVKSASPGGPVTKYRNTLPGLNAAATVDLIQNVIDFAPGAESAVHMHSSPNIGTVLAGQITVQMAAGERQAGVGQMLVEPVNLPLQAINNGSKEALVMVAFVVPHGGKPTVPVAGQPAPAIPSRTLDSFTLSSPAVSGGYSLVQQVLDFAPGSETPKHQHGGPGVVTVLRGSIVMSMDGVETTYGAGQSFVEMPGHTLQVFNRTTTDLLVAATFMLPDGAQLTTNV
jgi:quercetin dioxygenase-like cupin family protein